MPTLAQIWRHPVKGVGAEELTQVTLSAGRPLPLDRAWALLTGEAQDTGAWQHCRNFARGCYGPQLMAVKATTSGRMITFTHPDLDDLCIDPAVQGARLVDWIAPIYPSERPAPHTLITAPDEGMADIGFASVAVIGRGSLAALGERLGTQLDPRRFRANLWLDGLDAFAEFDLIGRSLRIGTAELIVRERITRCRATETSPETGLRDQNTLAALRDGWGHTDFGIYAQVTQNGTITPGDKVEIL